MPINYESEVLYSSKELSRVMRIPEEKLINVVTEKNLNPYNLNGEAYLKTDEIDNLVDEVLLTLGLSHRYYEIPEYLIKCTAPWAVTLVKMYQNKITYPASLSPDQGDFLRTLVCNVAPKNILEIGCFTGVSTVWLAAGLEQVGSEATIHSVDLFVDIMPRVPLIRSYLSDPLEYMLRSLEEAQLSHRVQVHKGNSREIGEKVDQVLNEPIDLLFIDGDHTVKGCYQDFILFYPYVPVGGYIILHDIYPKFCGWEGPRYVIDKFIKNSPHFDLLEIKTTPVNYGMAVIRKLGVDKNLELRSQLRKSAIWQKIKGKPLGNFIKKTVLPNK